MVCHLVKYGSQTGYEEARLGPCVRNHHLDTQVCKSYLGVLQPTISLQNSLEQSWKSSRATYKKVPVVPLPILGKLECATCKRAHL